MNKVEFAKLVASDLGRTQAEVSPVVDKVFARLAERMYQEDEVKIADFGTFGVKKREARTARNPQTGGTVEVPAKLAPYFKPSKALKEYVN